MVGTLPNITRNALVNCTELVTYDLIKEAILKHNLMSGGTTLPLLQLITPHMSIQNMLYFLRCDFYLIRLYCLILLLHNVLPAIRFHTTC